ncbi:MAG: acyl carrier protein [Candidatus Omnitrophota bacterium]|nr:acyl carrier protein [Candidatus Omnitrophota bacterium]
MSDIEKEIRELIAYVLEREPSEITPDVRLVEDLGVDSMMALEILAATEKKFKISIPGERLPEMNTLRATVAIAQEYLDAKGQSQ